MALSRIDRKFAALREEGRAALVTFTTAGDPDYDTALDILRGLPAAGADIIELGMAFSDPMADGPAIQAASIRALKSGMTSDRILQMAGEFRRQDQTTPLILMGYYNPIYIYGVDRFLKDALKAGVDGLIIVDLPPEEDNELAIPSRKVGMGSIHLATPTTNEARLKHIVKNGSGFLYYVSITGITGTAVPDPAPVKAAVEMIRRHSDLPVAVGFGIKSPETAGIFAEFADGVVVGSAIVDIIATNIDQEGLANPALESRVLDFVETLGRAVRDARHIR